MAGCLEVGLTPSEDAEMAAARLEEALERIARLAKRPVPVDAGGETAEIAARLDGLIAQLRQALAGAPG